MLNLTKKQSIAILSVLFMLCCLQNLSLASFSSVAIKYYHFFAILLYPTLLFRDKIVFPPIAVNIFFAMVIGISLFGAMFFGLSAFFINYMFAIYVLFLVINIGEDFNEADWLNMLKTIVIVLMVAVWIKNLVQRNIIIAFFRAPFGHPVVTCLFGGGVNLEATYMAMFIPLFFNDKRLWWYQIASIALSAVYASRTAILVNVLCLLGQFFIYIKDGKTKQVVYYIIGALLSFLFLYHQKGVAYIFTRFANVGNDPGSLGRLNMLRYVWQMFCEHPLGCGIGNSIELLEGVAGSTYTENNLHNLYIQMFIDLGFIGGLYYLLLAICFCLVNIKQMLRNPIVQVLGLYLFTSLVQFRGAEAPVYFFLAIYLQQQRLLQRE